MEGSVEGSSAGDVQRVWSGGPYEEGYGYCRALKVGRWVLVSGCTSAVEGRVRFPADPGAQVRVAIATAVQAIEEFGGTAADVVRTRMYVTHRRDCDVVGTVHAEQFGANPPVSTMVIVTGLLHPDMRVEIEVEAVLSEAGGGSAGEATGGPVGGPQDAVPEVQ